MNLSVQLAPKNKRGLHLANPVMTSSGTFGYGIEYEPIFDIHKLGAIVCKGTTLEPREGNPQPRITETPSGMLNAIGFQNIGVKALIKEKAPVWAKWRVPVIVNITGNTVEDFARLAGELEGVSGVSAIEINISCPNIKAGGAAFGTDPAAAASVISAVRAVTSLPLLVKMTQTSNIASVAMAAAKAGADALTVINTIKGMAIDITRRKPLLGNITGGLSGPAIKPVALSQVYDVAGAVDIPVVGSGGITSGRAAIEFVIAGASAVQVGSANLTTPGAPLRVLEEIGEFMRQEGIESLDEIRGAARR